MSDASVAELETRAQLARLAALLRVDESELDFLSALPVEALRELRDAVTERLFSADRGALDAIAASTRLVPGAVSAKIAVAAFPPTLAARVAGVLDTDRAVDLARRVPAAYLADLAPHLDPRRVRAILTRLPTTVIVGAGRLLGEREEHLTMATLVGVLDDEAIAAANEVLGDEALLRTGVLVEEPERLARVVRLLPEDRLRGLLRLAHEHGLWSALARALPHLDDTTRARVTDLAESIGLATT